jgi:hypothetical protein
MAFKIVSNLKDGVAGLLSGLDLSNVDNLYEAFERAARVLSLKAPIPETQGTQNLILYSGVTDYLIDTRIFGTQVLDIRPQGISRPSYDFVYHKFSDDFDRQKQYIKNGTMCTFAFSNGTPIIRIVSSGIKQQIILDPMTSIIGWTNNASITNLTTDTTFVYQQPGAIRFNLIAAGGTGYLEKTLQSPINLTSYQGASVAFLAVEIPSANILNYELRIGSDSSNYYAVTNTTGFLGNTLNEFMLVAFDQSLATKVGSPDITKIQYVRVTINYDGTAMQNVRLGDLFISLPYPAQILYNSNGFFRIGNVVSTDITSDTDEIILNDSAYSIYEYECALSILQQTGGGASDSTMASFESHLNGARARNGMVVQLGLYDLYRSDNPSAVLRTSGSYYSGSSYGGGYDNR